MIPMFVQPNCCIGSVVNRGKYFPSGKNHTDYVNAKGKYDIVGFITDHCEDFKFVYNFSVGKQALHITTEVYCEYLFSQAGHLLHPNCIRTIAETFEILVMVEHIIDHLYCCPEKVKMIHLEVEG